MAKRVVFTLVFDFGCARNNDFTGLCGASTVLLWCRGAEIGNKLKKFWQDLSRPLSLPSEKRMARSSTG